MNKNAVNKILNRIIRDVSRLQSEMNKSSTNVAVPTSRKKVIASQNIIACTDEYIQKIIKNGGL